MVVASMQVTNAALQPLLLTSYTLGICYLLSFLFYATQTSSSPTSRPTTALYQTQTIYLSLAHSPTSLDRNSIDHGALAITLFLHGLFTICHCLTLAGIQTLNKKINLFPFLKLTLFSTFMKVGMSLGYVLSLNNKANAESEEVLLASQDTTPMIRLFMAKASWLCTSFIWLTLSMAYGSLLCYIKTVRLRTWRSLMFFVGDYRGIPVVAYGCAGLLSLYGVLVPLQGHWCEPAFVGCLMGDCASLHQIWMRMRDIETENEEKKKE
jgi:hypothetical protein